MFQVTSSISGSFIQINPKMVIMMRPTTPAEKIEVPGSHLIITLVSNDRVWVKETVLDILVAMLKRETNELPKNSTYLKGETNELPKNSAY